MHLFRRLCSCTCSIMDRTLSSGDRNMGSIPVRCIFSQTAFLWKFPINRRFSYFIKLGQIKQPDFYLWTKSSLANSLARREFARTNTFPRLCDPCGAFYYIELRSNSYIIKRHPEGRLKKILGINDILVSKSQTCFYIFTYGFLHLPFCIYIHDLIRFLPDPVHFYLLPLSSYSSAPPTTAFPELISLHEWNLE